MLDADASAITENLIRIRGELRYRRAKDAVLPAPKTLSHKQWPPDYEAVYAWRAAQTVKMEQDDKFLQAAKKFYAGNCVAFINHWLDTYDPRNAGTDRPVWMPFVMFERQEEFVNFVLFCLRNECPGLVEKCRTMGATWLAVAISVWLWLFYPGVAIGWGSQKADSVSVIGDPDSIFEKLRMMIRRVPKVFLPEDFDDSFLKDMECINPDNKAVISGQVGDSIGRGGRKRVFFKDESAHYEHPELIEAALSENTRVPIDISSVNGLGNLFHRKREAGIDWHPGIKKKEPGRTYVFVMDWKDHPEYDLKWYKEKKKYHDDQGTPHVFAQEIERDYQASVQGVIIPREWVDAAIDAHIKLNIPVEGPKLSGLDIGDSEDGDNNAQSIRTGIVLTFCEEWVARDPGVTARKAMGNCRDHNCPELQYDAGGGLGSNVKSEVNRLEKDEKIDTGLTVVPWNPGGKVLYPARRTVPDDEKSPRNKDFYTNLKAQAWWEVRLRFYRTYQAVVGIADEHGVVRKIQHDPDDLISISSKLPNLRKIQKELCQATVSKGAKLKLLVDKSPEGTKSPNLADSIIIAYWPMPANSGDFTDVGFGPTIFVGGENL